MNLIHFADSRQMPELEDASVHLVITSPPYWQLKDYGAEAQIGYHDTYEEYIADLNQVWSECERVLAPGCKMCINIGDQFARAAYYGRYKIIPIRTEIIKHCEGIGLDYMGAIIWQKFTTCNTTGGGSVMGSYPFPRNGAIMIDYEFILVFKKLGKPPKVTPEIKEASRLTHEQWVEYFAGHWNVHGERQDDHLAVFPEEIPRRLIRMYSFVGETVLDPFLGSGTTVKVAAEEGRIGVGYEINEEFREVIEEKLGLRKEQGTLFGEGEGIEVEFATRDQASPPGPLSVPERGGTARGAGPAVAGSGPPSLRRLADPKAYDFGTRIDGRTKSGKFLVEVAQELAAQQDWPDLTERDKLTRIVEQVVAQTGADRKLVRMGTRNALLKVKRFAELVRGG